MPLIERFEIEASRLLKTRIHNYHKDNDGEHMFVNSMIVSGNDANHVRQGCLSAMTATELFNEHALTSPFTFENLWLNETMSVVYRFVYYIEQIDCYFDLIYCDGIAKLESNFANEDIVPESLDKEVLKAMTMEVQAAISFGLLLD